MNGHDAFLELAALYSVGALSDLDRRHFEAHLAPGCPECEAELSALRPAIDALADGVEPIAMRPELRDRVLSYAGMWARSGAERAAPPNTTRPPRRLPLLVAAAASVGIAAAFAAQVFSLRAELGEAHARSAELGSALAAEQQTLQQVRAEIEQSRATQQLLTAQIATLEATSRVLTAPATRSVALAGQGPGAAARARAFLSPDTGTVILYAYDLPELPADQTYQAWVIPGKTPVPIGVFRPEPGGIARHEASEVAGLAAPITVAVTIEPQGGLPQPSGPIVLAGK